MIQRLKNTIVLRVCGQEFTTCSDFKVYVSQGRLQFEYVPAVEDDTMVSLTIPYADAMQLRSGTCKVQMAWKDADNNSRATKVRNVIVEELIPVDGYR